MDKVKYVVISLTSAKIYHISKSYLKIISQNHFSKSLLKIFAQNLTIITRAHAPGRPVSAQHCTALL